MFDEAGRYMQAIEKFNKAIDYDARNIHAYYNLTLAFKHAGFIGEWRGAGLHETFNDLYTGDILMSINPKFYRPAEVETLIGDCTKVKTKLGWKPEYTFKKLVEEMCDYDLKKAMEKKNEYVY